MKQNEKSLIGTAMSSPLVTSWFAVTVEISKHGKKGNNIPLYIKFDINRLILKKASLNVCNPCIADSQREVIQFDRVFAASKSALKATFHYLDEFFNHKVIVIPMKDEIEIPISSLLSQVEEQNVKLGYSQISVLMDYKQHRSARDLPMIIYNKMITPMLDFSMGLEGVKLLRSLYPKHAELIAKDIQPVFWRDTNTFSSFTLNTIDESYQVHYDQKEFSDCRAELDCASIKTTFAGEVIIVIGDDKFLEQVVHGLQSRKDWIQVKSLFPIVYISISSSNISEILKFTHPRQAILALLRGSPKPFSGIRISHGSMHTFYTHFAFRWVFYKDMKIKKGTFKGHNHEIVGKRFALGNMIRPDQNVFECKISVQNSNIHSEFNYLSTSSYPSSSLQTVQNSLQLSNLTGADSIDKFSIFKDEDQEQHLDHSVDYISLDSLGRKAFLEYCHLNQASYNEKLLCYSVTVQMESTKNPLINVINYAGIDKEKKTNSLFYKNLWFLSARKQLKKASDWSMVLSRQSGSVVRVEYPHSSINVGDIMSTHRQEDEGVFEFQILKESLYFFTN